MVTPITGPIDGAPLVDKNARIPGELHAHSKVYQLNTVGDAREALARLRELRRDFEGSIKGCESSPSSCHSEYHPIELPGKGERMLASLSNVQRMRTIRSEIAYLEDLMVQIAAHDFEVEEARHQAYLLGIGQWTMLAESGHRAI